jgi:uncharacterized membrane protein YciS (DUF1049 family)
MRRYLSLQDLKMRTLEGELWIDKLSRFTYCDKISLKLFNDKKYGPYILILFIFLITDPILQLIGYLRFGWTIYHLTPFNFILLYGGLFFGIWAIRRYVKYYNNMNKNLKKNKVTSSIFLLKPITPKYLKFIILIIGIFMISCRIGIDLINTLQTSSIIGNPEFNVQTMFSQDWYHGIILSFVYYFVYVPIIVEFVTLFLSIHLYFPIRFNRLIKGFNSLVDKYNTRLSSVDNDEDREYIHRIIYKNFINLNYSDPHLFCGLKPLGDLFLESSGLYFIGVTFFIFATVFSPWRIGLFSALFFIGAIFLGFFLFFMPQISIHNYMKKMKKKKLEEIDKMMRNEGSDIEGALKTEPFNIKDAVQYIHRYVQYNHANKLREYPFDITTIRDLILTAIIPISSEVVIRIYFHCLGM